MYKFYFSSSTVLYIIYMMSLQYWILYTVKYLVVEKAVSTAPRVILGRASYHISSPKKKLLSSQIVLLFFFAYDFRAKIKTSFVLFPLQPDDKHVHTKFGRTITGQPTR